MAEQRFKILNQQNQTKFNPMEYHISRTRTFRQRFGDSCYFVASLKQENNVRESSNVS